MAPIEERFHHRSTTKGANKPFKTRHASKSALKEREKGRVDGLDKGSRKTPHQQVMGKIDRRNHAKQVRSNKLAARANEQSVFTGRDGAPRIVAVIPLCKDVDSKAIVRNLNGSVDVDQDVETDTPLRVEVPRFKQRVQYLTPRRGLWQCLDACRVADFVLFVLSANEEVDEIGEQVLRCVESQGVSTVLTGVFNLDAVGPAKKRPDVVKSLKSFITHFFATQEKVHDFSSRQDCSNVMRSLCTTTPKGVRWREDRSWMLLDDFCWEGDHVVATGMIRGRALNADRLVQVGDWGDFQINSISAAPMGTRKKSEKVDGMVIDADQPGEELQQPSDQRDDLAELAPEEATMDDMATASLAPSERRAVLLDDHHYFDEDDENEQLVKPTRLPRGTSKYQAAWYLGDVSDSGSDLESVDGDDEDGMEADALFGDGPAEGHFPEDATVEPTEAGAPSEYPESEVFNDQAPEDEAEEIAAYRRRRRDDGEEDLEFPDEIELHPHVLARERLARYRGLKSLRTSTWDTEEDIPHEPEEWSKLLEISDYKSAKNRTLKDALIGGVKAGTRVNVRLRIPEEQITALQALAHPTALFSLLKHEHKRTAVNTSITLSSDLEQPVKSKEDIIMQCGPRRLVIKPLFSQAGNTPNNVHKFDRYLHPGRTAVASFIGPLIWGSVPCLYFKRTAAPPAMDAMDDLANALSTPKTSLEFIGTGTNLPPSTSRVVAKRVILTGHPYKIHKKLVTVRYMFFNKDDVQYFRALQLWTRRGRSGFMKEALGTHGYFKATFDGRINPMDAVAVSLYKRVWPRNAVFYQPQLDEAGVAGEEAPKLVDEGEMMVD